eukprot:4846351-Amphidinium_carterae.1
MRAIMRLKPGYRLWHATNFRTIAHVYVEVVRLVGPCRAKSEGETGTMAKNPATAVMLPAAHLEVGPHKCVVKHETFAQCLDCYLQQCKARGDFSFHVLRCQDHSCGKLRFVAPPPPVSPTLRCGLTAFG